MKKFLLGFCSAAFLAVACVLIFNGTAASTEQNGDLMARFGEIDRLIEDHAIMEFDEALADDYALSGYVYGLKDDLYAEYLPASYYEDFLYESEGNFMGIGISIIVPYDPIREGIIVSRPLGNSKAEEAGLLPGDVIVSVNGTSLEGMYYEDAYDMMMDEEGTTAVLTVKRGEETLTFEIVRSAFLQRDVDYGLYGAEDPSSVSLKKDPVRIGYIQIHSFHQNVYADFEAALNHLLEQGADGFLFDVRNNPGGNLDTVVNMLNLLVPKDELVVLQYKHDEEVIYSDGFRKTDLPCVVLLNSESASASELFASALRDLCGTKLVGTSSFGKGIGQTTYSLDDGSGLKLTTFKYVTKSRTDYNKVGLIPDVEIGLPDDMNPLLLYTLTKAEDPQMQTAMAVLTNEILASK